MSNKKPSLESSEKDEKAKKIKKAQELNSQEKEIGGFENREEPTRFGDWEVNGRCSDF